MNAIIGKLGGRSFIVALVGLILVIVTATTGLEISEDIKKQVIEAIMLIVGIHSAGRGIADGLSGGKTSTTVLKPVEGKVVEE